MWKFLDPSNMQKMERKSLFLMLMKKVVPFGFKRDFGFDGQYTGTGTIRKTNSISSAASASMRRFSAGAAYHQKWFHAKGMLFPGSSSR